MHSNVIAVGKCSVYTLLMQQQLYHLNLITLTERVVENDEDYSSQR